MDSHQPKPMTTSQVLELIIRALPYPEQIRNIRITEQDVRFFWRSQSFCVEPSRLVWSVGNGVLIGDDASILLQSLIENAYHQSITTNNQ